MSESANRYEYVAKISRAVLIGTAVLLGISLVATVVMAVLSLLSRTGGTNSLLWVLLVVVELVALMWTAVMDGAIKMMLAGQVAAQGATAQVSRVEALLDDTVRAIRELAELAPLSDQAKSLLFRDRELEALREAIHEDLMKQDYATAEALVETIETRLGFADEATRLREEIQRSRVATVEEKMDLALQRIDDLCAAYKWASAIRESQRVLRVFPENPKASSLPDRIKQARNNRKRELLQAYGEAIRKNDVDRGIDLLQDLDAYLTPQEGAALQESARGVFKARLHNLGVQFAICVTDQRWTDAIAAGKEIIQGFPNSRFAQEVREKMDLLQSRAIATAAGGESPDDEPATD